MRLLKPTWMLASLLVITSSCQNPRPPGDTGADARLTADVTRMVGMFEGPMSQPKLVTTKIVSREGSNTVEHWTYECGGKTVTYVVTFMPSPMGGTDFNIAPLEAKPGD